MKNEIGTGRIEKFGFVHGEKAQLRLATRGAGGNLPAAAIDCARTACREAELGLLAVHEAKLLNPTRADLILQSLNRLSDVLWLEARRAESAIAAPQA